MVILIVLLCLTLFILADIGVRAVLARNTRTKQLREREAALAESLVLDFTREARTLKRVEVRDCAARILCVDDEQVILDSFRKILVLDGYSVDTVETGQEALGLVQARQYDFLFTDLKMPAMDGVEVVKAVRHMRPDIDVIIITGHAAVETAVECMKHGAMDYIQKPFTEGELLAFVKKAMFIRAENLARQLKPQVRVTRSGKEGEVRAGEFSVPGGVFISRGHCWAAMNRDGAVKTGIDDFAGKLLGPVDSVELPETGKTVKAGDPLFKVRQGKRTAQFLAPVSGKVAKVNQELGKSGQALAGNPYHDNWVCVLEDGNLDAELPALKIGKSAVALFHEDFERYRAAMLKLEKSGALKARGDGAVYAGEMRQLGDADWESLADEFFRRQPADKPA